MTTIRAFFLQIRALFFQFSKSAGETPPTPSSYAPESKEFLSKTIEIYEKTY